MIRDGAEARVDPSELRAGDRVIVGRGEQIAADGDVLEGELEVDESLVTGESVAVVRRPGERLLSGSVCLSGRATMRVTQAGPDSYASRLTTKAKEGRVERTPLQRDVERLIATTAVLVIAVSAVVAVTSIGRGAAPGEVVQAAAVLVALVPQGLAIMSTLSYALGAVRISRAGALVQRISAVEAISRVDALVLDKTGTITNADLELSEVRWLSGDAPSDCRLLRALAGAAGSSDRVGEAIGRWLDANQPSEVAPSWPGLAGTVPFSSARRWSAATLAGPDGPTAILGAPEVLLDRSREPDLLTSAEPRRSPSPRARGRWRSSPSGSSTCPVAGRCFGPASRGPIRGEWPFRTQANRPDRVTPAHPGELEAEPQRRKIASKGRKERPRCSTSSHATGGSSPCGASPPSCSGSWRSPSPASP